MTNPFGLKRTLQVLMALILALGMVLPVLGTQKVMAQATPTPTPTAAPKEVNVELILDSSGSMAEEISPGETRIEAAKSVLTDVIDILPTTPGINVGFRVYGHKGNNTQSGKSVSCQSSELRVPIDGVDKEALQDEVDAYEPVGWTPIALSLNQAADDFPAASPDVRNAVVLVTDGLETCGGNPCTASRQLVNSAGEVVTHVIGFALTPEEQGNLQCIVDESGGLLLGAGNAAELSEALFTVLEELEVVVQNGQLEIESIGGLYPKATVTGTAGANDSNPNPTPFSGSFNDTNILDVPAGSYTVTWQTPAGATVEVLVVVDPGQKTVIRGSLFRFPHGNGEVYTLTDQSGVLIWNAPIEYGDVVWLIPGVYRLSLAEVTGDAAILSLDVQTLPGSVTEVGVTVTP
jgi:hypothetical protein